MDEKLISKLTQLKHQEKKPKMLTKMSGRNAAVLLITLNGRHPSLAFTMELPLDNKNSFIGIEMVKNRTKIETQVYRKSTETGLLLHHSHR